MLNVSTDDIKRKFGNEIIKPKMEEYISLKSKKIIVDQNRLFDTIVKKGGYKSYFRLASIIVKHLRIKDGYERYISKLLLSNYDDKTIYEKIKSHKSKSKDTSYRDYLHALVVYKEFYLKFINENKNFRVKEYLDIGCGNGNTALSLAKMLNIKESNVYCTELKRWGTFVRSNSDINIKNTSLVDDFDKLPYDNNFFDLITSFMVLHHLKDMNSMLKEINRTLKKGGLLIIREHDSYNEIDYILNEIEHGLYDIVHHEMDYEAFKKDYYAKYYDIYEWRIILERFGFKYFYSNYDSSSVKFEVSPTRYFISVYVKN